MKKILCIVGPFLPSQTAYVYEDGNKLDIVEFSINDVNEILDGLINKYNIETLELRGPKQFSAGIWTNLSEYQKTKYKNKKTLNVKYL